MEIINESARASFCINNILIKDSKVQDMADGKSKTRLDWPGSRLELFLQDQNSVLPKPLTRYNSQDQNQEKCGLVLVLGLAHY